MERRSKFLDAARFGDFHTISKLVAKGANVNMVDKVLIVHNFNTFTISELYVFVNKDGATALMIAACGGHHECVSILLAHGADNNFTTKVSALSSWTQVHASNLIRQLSFFTTAMHRMRDSFNDGR